MQRRTRRRPAGKSPTRVTVESPRIQNKRGQVLGPKGEGSRQRIIDGAFDLLAKNSVWNIGVTDICTHCDIAPSNLYTYFASVEEVVLALAEQVLDCAPPLTDILRGDWSGRGGLKLARAYVEEDFKYWEKYRPVLKVVELLADEGNCAFGKIRERRILPIYDAMQPIIVKAQQQGGISRKLEPKVVAMCAHGVIESGAMHLPIILQYGHKAEDLMETHARLLLLHLIGRDD